jgi:enoyl-CoA hydratase/carnithine racemase
VTIEPSSFRYQHDDASGVATITLDRPERLNALTFEVYRELREAFVALDTEPGVRAVLITGSGKAFCSGGDVEDIIGALFGRDYRGLLAFTRDTGALILAMLRCRRPIVGALNGTVAGAGAVITAACDVRIAAESARIAYLFTKVGLSGADMGASWLLPRLVGMGRAMELLMTGDFVDARRAYEIGLYNRVVPAAELEAMATEWAQKLASGPTMGLAITKRMLNLEAALSVGEAMQVEGWIQAECMKHPDYREAYEAFVAKRAPDFVANAPGGRTGAGARA